MVRSTGVRDIFSQLSPAKASASQKASPRKPSPAGIDPASFDNAVAALRLHLGCKYATGEIQATDIAHLAYLLCNCGLPLADLAVNPDTASFSANCSRKIRAAFKMQDLEQQLLHEDVPCVEGRRRVVVPQPFRLLPQMLAAEFQRDPKATLGAAAALAGIPNWEANAVKQECDRLGQICIPWGLFADAATWRGKGPGTKDSVMNYFMNIPGLPRRRTITCIRKELMCGEVCDCPCRGRCSMDSLEHVITWMANWAAAGYNPEKDYSDRSWLKLSGIRPGEAVLVHEGQVVRFALIEVRADWDQFAGGMGFARTNQSHPCMMCPAPVADLHRYPLQDIHEPYTNEAYTSIVQKSQVSVLLDRGDVETIFANLRFDDRKDNGMHGRVVGRDLQVHCQINGLTTLQKDDRLCTEGAVRDVHWTPAMVFARSPGPWRVHFWRKSSEPGVQFSFRSPFMGIAGMCFKQLMIDDLHCLDLGLAARLSGHAMVLALRSTVLGNVNTENGVKYGCTLLTEKIKKFYSTLPKKSKISQIGRITLKRLSVETANDRGHLKGKAHEARCALPFATKLLTRRLVKKVPQAKYVKRACKCLLKAYGLMARSKTRAIDAACLGKLLVRVARNAIRGGVHVIPKFHLAQHLGQLAARAGNPARFSAYLDESHNKSVVQVAQACSAPLYIAIRVLSREMLLDSLRP